MMRTRRGFGVMLFLAVAQCALAAPPTLFSRPGLQSPVRGDPGDLLLLAGDGLEATDTVAYQIIADPSAVPAPPAALPVASDSSAGTATVISTLDVPNSLTIKLPTVMLADTTYVLWVQNAAGEWSNSVKINDARPLWISPDTVYETTRMAFLPRELKVVGRNLQPAPEAVTTVRLHGPADFVLEAINDHDPTTAIEHYVAKVALPQDLPPGSYCVESESGWHHLDPGRRSKPDGASRSDARRYLRCQRVRQLPTR